MGVARWPSCGRGVGRCSRGRCALGLPDGVRCACRDFERVSWSRPARGSHQEGPGGLPWGPPSGWEGAPSYRAVTPKRIAPAAEGDNCRPWGGAPPLNGVRREDSECASSRGLPQSGRGSRSSLARRRHPPSKQRDRDRRGRNWSWAVGIFSGRGNWRPCRVSRSVWRCG